MSETERIADLVTEVRRLRGLTGMPAVPCLHCGKRVGFHFQESMWTGGNWHDDGWDNCHNGSVLLGTFAAPSDKRAWHKTDGSCCNGACLAALGEPRDEGGGDG